MRGNQPCWLPARFRLRAEAAVAAVVARDAALLQQLQLPGITQ